MTMPNTKDVPGPFDGFATAKPGEPIFTLQGGDPLAPPLVHSWAMSARDRAIAEFPEDHPKRDALFLRAAEAEKVAWQMEEYLAGDEAKPPREVPVTYSGVTPTEAALDAIERNRVLMHANSRLNNAVYEANEQVDALKALGLDDAAHDIIAACNVLKAAALTILPARPGASAPETVDE